MKIFQHFQIRFFNWHNVNFIVMNRQTAKQEREKDENNISFDSSDETITKQQWDWLM